MVSKNVANHEFIPIEMSSTLIQTYYEKTSLHKAGQVMYSLQRKKWIKRERGDLFNAQPSATAIITCYKYLIECWKIRAHGMDNEMT